MLRKNLHLKASTFSDDTAVLDTESDPAIAFHKLQTGLLAIQPGSKHGA
jgi:hypothetical protein